MMLITPRATLSLRRLWFWLMLFLALGLRAIVRIVLRALEPLRQQIVVEGQQSAGGEGSPSPA
jgi:hypothetical protein